LIPEVGEVLAEARTSRNGVMRLLGLQLPMGTKVLAATFAGLCGAETTKETT
jgi:hypothetical protein